MGYDQDIYNRISTLESDVLDATSSFAVAKAAKDALDKRLSAFKVELDDAQNTRTTAQSNYAAAKSTQDAVIGALKAALQSTIQSLIIYKNVRDVFDQACIAAELSMVTGYTMSALLAQISAAEAKNSYITPQLLALAQRTDDSAATAVSAALTAMQDSMGAFVAAERSVWTSCLVVVSTVDVLHLMGGTTPDVLSHTPSVPDLGALKANSPQQLQDALEKIMKPWLQALLLGKKEGEDNTSEEDDSHITELVDGLVAKIQDASEESKTVKDEVSQSLLKRLEFLRIQADNHEAELQRATTSATSELLVATQVLARNQARLDAYQKALSAAKQAVGA
jgi:hypothetical protein